MSTLISKLGHVVFRFFVEAGEIFTLLGKILAGFKGIFHDRRLLFEQLIVIGYSSLPIVLLVGTFTGAVSAWQTNYQIQNYVPIRFLGLATYKAVVIELGPVLTALMLAGRVGASIAAELGTMKVTEQIDALESLAINSVRYLAVPRFYAAIFMMPILAIFSDFIAVTGAWFVANVLLGVPTTIFFSEIRPRFSVYDVSAGLIKSIFFGAIIALIGCYIGFHTSGGAEGVGKATIRSFVLSAILILIFDYVLAIVFF
jgi:phospholipid/cholesterol/gamma-HCH transport system permease protein